MAAGILISYRYSQERDAVLYPSKALWRPAEA